MIQVSKTGCTKSFGLWLKRSELSKTTKDNFPIFFQLVSNRHSLVEILASKFHAPSHMQGRYSLFSLTESFILQSELTLTAAFVY